MKKVVIGVPVYNGSDYLYDSLKSIQRQTFSDFLVLISDNCSNDKTKEICSEFVEKDNRFFYFLQDKNIGASANFDYLLSKASAEYFMFLGHDDKISENFLELCVNYLDDNPNISITSGIPFYYLNNKLKFTGVVHNHLQKNAGLRLINYYYRVKDNGIFYGLIRMKLISNESFPRGVGGDHFWIAGIISNGPAKVIENCNVHRNIGLASSKFGSNISIVIIIEQANSYLRQVYLRGLKMLKNNTINISSFLLVIVVVFSRMYVKRLLGIKQFQIRSFIKNKFKNFSRS